MQDPKAAVNQIAEEIQKKADEAGLGKAGEFLDKLKEMKQQAEAGPGDIMDKIKSAIDDFKKKIQDAIDDPSSLAPPGIAACASWYGNAVVAKLKDIMKDVETLIGMLTGVISDMMEKFKGLGATLQDAPKQINTALEGMAGLPNTLKDIAGKVTGPGDVANIDTKSMKSSLDTSSIDEPLKSLGGLKDSMGSVAESVGKGAEDLEKFLQEAPSRVKGCFEVPNPMCCLTSCVAPDMLKKMLDHLEALSKLDLKPIVEKLKELVENLGKIDVDSIKKPMDDFSKAAGEQVEKLDKVVDGAKMAGGMGDMAKKGKMPKIGKKMWG